VGPVSRLETARAAIRVARGELLAWWLRRGPGDSPLTPAEVEESERLGAACRAIGEAYLAGDDPALARAGAKARDDGDVVELVHGRICA